MCVYVYNDISFGFNIHTLTTCFFLYIKKHKLQKESSNNYTKLQEENKRKSLKITK